MPKDENVYVAPDGKQYKAVESCGCIGCHFDVTRTCGETRSHGRPDCTGRIDHRSVIWVPDDSPALTELTAEPAFPGTLRDWFAGMALTGLVSACNTNGEWTADGDFSAARAYNLADAMMKARDV